MAKEFKNCLQKWYSLKPVICTPPSQQNSPAKQKSQVIAITAIVFLENVKSQESGSLGFSQKENNHSHRMLSSKGVINQACLRTIEH